MDVPVETLTPPLPKAPHDPARGPRAGESTTHADASLALERIATYCQALGLRDQQRARDIAREVVNRVMADHPKEDGRAWMRLGMDALFERVDAWLDALSQHVGRERHLVATSLPIILRDQPALFLQTDHLPEPDGLLHGVCGRPTSLLPPSAHHEMPRQRFGKPPAVLRPGFWFRLWRWGQHEQHPIERMIGRRGNDEC